VTNVEPPCSNQPERGAQLESTEERVASVIEDVRRQTLQQVRPYVLAGIGPVVVFSIVEIARGHATVWAVLQAVIIAVMGVAFFVVRQTRRLAFVVCLGAAGLCTTGLMHYGPLLGTGVLFALSVLAFDFFFGRRSMFLVFGYLVLLTIGAGVYASLGAAPPWWPGPLDKSAWARLVIGMVFRIALVALLFDNALTSMRTAITNQVAARLKQQEAESEREQALSAAMTSQRLETLGELAAGVAHDVNNTLVVIQGTLEALSKATPAEREELIAEGLTAVRGGSQTARRLLGLARHSSEDVGRCDPASVITSTAKAIQRVLPAGFVVEVVCEPCPLAAMSEGALEQILLNLLVNARDASGGHGRVEVRCKHEGGRVRIHVEDDGPGMSAEIRARAFEPFFTTKARGEGTGLGLALVQRLVQKASGTLTLETDVGKGAHFTIDLPTVVAKAADDVPLSATRGDAGKRILVVEDDPQVRRMIERALSRAGYEVTVVPTVGEARSRLASCRYDLLITDGKLPDGNAGGVLEAYRAHHADGPAVICTGYLDDDDVLAQLERDSKLVLVHKPFATTALLELTAHLIQLG